MVGGGAGFAGEEGGDVRDEGGRGETRFEIDTYYHFVWILISDSL